MYKFLLDPKEEVIPRGLKPPGNVLEVGCGYGRYLTQLRKEGWTVEGLEPGEINAPALPQDVSIVADTIGHAEYSGNHFDLVVTLMVLEHLHSPLQDLRRILGWIRPGGYIMGSVPNCDCWEWHFFRERWFALQLPQHLFHYTPETLTRLLATAGFEETRIFYQRNLNSPMVNLGWWLAKNRLPFANTFITFPESGPWYLRLAVRPIASMLAWMRQSGRITFTARKPLG
jgi:SAM-dependent methyltransferase